MMEQEARRAMADFKGTSCVVTGAASGIGEAVARLLVAAGAEVTSLDLKPPSVEVSRHLPCDLSRRESIDESLRELTGRFGVVCNVAGVPGTCDRDLVLKVNLLGLRHFTEGMIDRVEEGGSVVNVASTAGFGWMQRVETISALLATPDFDEGARWYAEHGPDVPPYNFSKEALIVYTMSLGHRLWRRGIRVNAVSPGPVATPILLDFEASMGKDVLDGVRAVVGRHAQPDDIAPVIAFLASPAARWVNGANIVADGGLLGGMLSGLVPMPGGGG